MRGHDLVFFLAQKFNSSGVYVMEISRLKTTKNAKYYIRFSWNVHPHSLHDLPLHLPGTGERAELLGDAIKVDFRRTSTV